MSYVDLMSNVRWTDADHVNWSETYVESKVPHRVEHILLRRTLALLIHLLLSSLPPDDPLQTEFGALAVPPDPTQIGEILLAASIFQEAEVRQNTGRSDAELLNSALDVEQAQDRLALPAVATIVDDIGNVINQADVDADSAQRAAAQAVVSAASSDVMNLVAIRPRAVQLANEAAEAAAQTPPVA